MSGLAIFSLKYPSLLQFDNDKRDSIKEHNLKTLYGIDITPSDTYLRERLDELPASELRDAFTALIRQAQRGKVLEKFTYYNGHYLFSMDGTGYFSSHEIHCDVVKNIIGQVTYYHQMLGIALNGPHIKLLNSLNMSYILSAKPNDHTHLFNWIENNSQYYQTQDDDGTIHKYRYINQAPLNDTHFDLNINFLIYQEINMKGKVKNFSWVTDIALSEQTLKIIMRGGRAR